MIPEFQWSRTSEQLQRNLGHTGVAEQTFCVLSDSLLKTKKIVMPLNMVEIKVIQVV